MLTSVAVCLSNQKQFYVVGHIRATTHTRGERRLASDVAACVYGTIRAHQISNGPTQATERRKQHQQHVFEHAPQVQWGDERVHRQPRHICISTGSLNPNVCAGTRTFSLRLCAISASADQSGAHRLVTQALCARRGASSPAAQSGGPSGLPSDG